jgi:hypothetical protein
MRALVWIVEDSWQAKVAEATVCRSGDSEIMLLHVTGTEALRAISVQAAQELLAAAEARPGAKRQGGSSRGRAETGGGDCGRRAWTSSCWRATATISGSGRAASVRRHFVVDHAPCRVSLIWPDVPPGVSSIAPPSSLGAAGPGGFG